MKMFKAVNPATSKVEFYFSNPEVHANPIKIYPNEAQGIEAFLKRTGNLELVCMYKGRFKQVMALNLDFYSTPLCMGSMMNELFTEIKTNENVDFKQLIIRPEGQRQYIKDIERRQNITTSVLLSLFIAWKSEYAIRYGRSKTYYANVKRYYNRDYYELCNYTANKTYSMLYNLETLNSIFDNLHDLKYVEVKKGDIIPELGKGVQTRIFPQEKLINIFKKYEDQIDLNCIGYLRDTEHIISNNKNKIRNFCPVTIKDDNKKFIPLYEIQKNVSMKLELDGILEKINKINDYYSKNLKVEIVNPTSKNNNEIRFRSKSEHRLSTDDDLEDSLKNKLTLLPSGNIFLENIKMRRIFNNGSLKQGGRLYNDYQNLPKDIRQNLLINNEEVTCLDMQASQINMLYHLKGLECKLQDPYNIFEGYRYNNLLIESLPNFHKELRSIVKKITLIIINANNVGSALGAINEELGEDIIKFKSKYKYHSHMLNILGMVRSGRNNRYELSKFKMWMTKQEQWLTNEIQMKEKIKEEIKYERNIQFNLKHDDIIYSDEIDEFGNLKYFLDDVEGDCERFIACQKFVEKEQTKYYKEMEEEKREKEVKHFAFMLIEIIKKIHEPIEKNFHSGMGVKLQKHESDIVINTINRMIDEQNTPVLSVHDEIIVPNSIVNFAHDAFIQEYRKIFKGYSCILTDSTGKDFKTSNKYRITTEEQLIKIRIETKELLELKNKKRNLVYA